MATKPAAFWYSNKSVGQFFLLDSIRWRHMIRNVTIRNRDSHRSIFLNFLLRVKDLVNSDCRFGFLVKNCIYSRLEMSRILNSEPKIRNFQTLVPKNAISYRMSPPYGKCPGSVRDISRRIPRIFQNFPGKIPDISRECPGKIQEMSTIFLRNF